MKRVFEPFADVLTAAITPFVVAPMNRGADTNAVRFMKRNHYTQSCANQQSGVYGLFDGKPFGDQSNLLGVLMFAPGNSESVRSCVFGAEHKSAVTTLHRLFIADGTPTNTESWFIAESFRLHRQLRPDHKAVLSYADPAAGHVGTIYQACNGLPAGKSSGGGKLQFVTPEGGIRTQRQCGHNLSISEGEERGWTAVRIGDKWRYLWLLPQDRREERVLRGQVILSAEIPVADGRVTLRGWDELKLLAYPKQLTLNGNPTFRAGK